MSPRGKTSLKYSISGALTLGFLYVAFRDTDFVKVYEGIRSADYWWMLVMFMFIMISHVVRSWRWRYMLEPVKPGIRFRHLFSGVMVGYFLNNILPRAGELVRPYTIGKLAGVPKSAALGTIVVERIIDTISFLALVAAIPLVYDGPLRESFPWLEETGFILFAVAMGTVLMFFALMIRRDWTDRLLGIAGRVLPERFARRLQAIGHSFLDGFVFLIRPGRFLIISVLSILVWGLYVMAMQVSFYAFGLQPELGLRSAIVIQAIASIGFAMPTPGATGTYHYFTSMALVSLFKVPSDIALSFATVTHGIPYVGVTIIGLYYFFHDHIKVSDAVESGQERRG